MCNTIINIYVKSIDNDVTHRKIFTVSKLLVIFYIQVLVSAVHKMSFKKLVINAGPQLN